MKAARFFCIAIVVFVMTFFPGQGGATSITIHNLRHDKSLWLHCIEMGPRCIPYGKSHTFDIFGVLDLLMPGCYGTWGASSDCSGGDQTVNRFVAYNVPRDSPRCEGGCQYKATGNGWYGWNNATRHWDLLVPFGN